MDQCKMIANTTKLLYDQEILHSHVTADRLMTSKEEPSEQRQSQS